MSRVRKMAAPSGQVEFQEIRNDEMDSPEKNSGDNEDLGKEMELDKSEDGCMKPANGALVAKAEQIQEAPLQAVMNAADAVGSQQATHVIDAQTRLMEAAKINLPDGFYGVDDLSCQPKGHSGGEQLSVFFKELRPEGQLALLIGAAVVLCVLAFSAGFAVFVLTTGACVLSYHWFHSQQQSIEVKVKGEVKKNITDKIAKIKDSHIDLARNLNEQAVNLGKNFLETVENVHKIRSVVQTEEIQANREIRTLGIKCDVEIKTISENALTSRDKAMSDAKVEVVRIEENSKSQIAGKKVEVDKMREAIKGRLGILMVNTDLSRKKLEIDSSHKVAEIEADRDKYAADQKREIERQNITAKAENEKELRREETTRVKIRHEAEISRAKIDASARNEVQIEADTSRGKIEALRIQEQAEIDKRRVATDFEKELEFQKQETSRMKIKRDAEVQIEKCKADANINIEKEVTNRVEIREQNSCILM